MSAYVAMLIICWMPQPNGELKEVWRIAETVTAEHCLQMTTFGGGGKIAAITVQCKSASDGGER